jgi:hypothetical protein
MLGMSSTPSPKCAVCDVAGKWCCVICNSNCYCDEHACNHIARNYPEEFGLKPKPEQAAQQENRHVTRYVLIALAVLLGWLLLTYLWKQPGDGSQSTLIAPSLPERAGSILSGMAEFQSKVIAALQRSIPGSKCPLCGHSDWAVQGGVYWFKESIRTPFAESNAPALPSAAMVCKVCGNTHFINLQILGPEFKVDL